MPDYSVRDSDVTFETISGQEYVPQPLKSLVRGADVVFVPRTDYHSNPNPLFAEGTSNLYDYLLDKFDEESVQVPVEDDNFKELALHDAIVGIALLVNGILAPLLVNAISQYIQERRNSAKRSTSPNIEVTLYIDNKTGKSMEFKYNGPADQFDQAYNLAFPNEFDQEQSSANGASSTTVESRFQRVEIE